MAQSKSIPVANYLVEFKRNKFRISLPSRREDDDQSKKILIPCSEVEGENSIRLPFVKQLPRTSTDPFASTQTFKRKRIDGKNGRLSNSAEVGCREMQEYLEYVYFNEDLLSRLFNLLDVLCEGNTQVLLDHNLIPIINFRCMVYNGDMLCFNLLIRCDGHVIDITDTNVTARGGPVTCQLTGQAKSSIPSRTKVFDNSIIYLFKETTNRLQKTISSVNIESDTATNADDEQDLVQEVVMEMQLEENCKEIELANTTPDLDTLPYTVSTISVSSESDMCTQIEDETTRQERIEQTEEDCFGSGEMEDWEDIEDDILPRVSLEEEQDRANLALLAERPFELGSMSTIYSEESFEVVVDEEENKLLDFDLYSTEVEDDLETNRQHQLEPEKKLSSQDLETVHEEKKSLKDAKVIDDPYENPESLQAQERSLEEKDLVYSQTMEIVSDDEYDEEGQFRRERVKLDDLSVLLDKMPLQDVQLTKKYIRDNLLLKKTDIKMRQELVSQMEKVLCKNGFNCQLYIFGSTKNWLGLRSSSDIDIFIQLKDSRGRPIDESYISYGKIEHVLHRIDRILGEDQSYLQILTGSNASGADINIETICHKHMRVPITRLKIYLDSVSLSHSPSSGITLNNTSPDQVLQCDLNANNALGIANTRLIRFLCKFEPRFFVLNVLLRYWSKHVGHLNKPDILSSYALTNLILFFCQTRKPQILPSVDYFVKLSTHPKIVNDWRCDFCKDRDKIEFRTQNNESIMQLFVGFFRYYSTFNFLQMKISTRYGRAWRLRNRRQPGDRFRGATGGTSRRNSDRMPAVHIMDPFEQSHNLTGRMRSQMFDRMCAGFEKAAEQYRKYISPQTDQ